MPKLKSPVIAGWEEEELVVKGGKNFGSMPVLPHRALGYITARWEPSNEERKRIAEGADIYVSIKCGEKVQPHRVVVLNADDRGKTKARDEAASLLLGYNPDMDLKCEVCGGQALTVAASPIGAVGVTSHAICYDCMTHYRVPWMELIKWGAGPGSGWFDQRYLHATCDYYHKTVVEFWQEVIEHPKGGK